MKAFSALAITLTVVGAINWGLVGLGYFLGTPLNLVNLLLGSWIAVEYGVYIAVGVCGLLVGYVHLTNKCTMCEH